MRRLTLTLGLATALCAVSPLSADTTSLQSILVNVNGSQYTDYSVPGVNTSAWDATTGIGTLTFTFNPGAAGSYFLDIFFDHQLNLPFYNEFGTVNGAPVAGQSYAIGDSYLSSIYTDVQAGGALSNTNSLPGTASNFFNDCVTANCNGDFAAAMGFSFTLAANEYEVLSFTVSHTNPGGFSLQDTHPVDAANPTALDLFISGNARTVPVSTGPVPEPFSVVLLGTVMVLVLVSFRRRSRAA